MICHFQRVSARATSIVTPCKSAVTRFMSQGSFSRKIPQSEEPFDKPTPAAFKTYNDRIKKYNELVQKCLEGGGPRGIERHVKTNKKVLVRDRIKMLIDTGTPFFEIGALAGFEMMYGDLPAAGVVAGIGRVKGVYCMISGNDATVKAGTYFPISVKKNYRTQEIAEINRLPCIYMPDSGGAFLPLQSEIFPDKKDGGRGFYSQAIMSSLGIPQIAIVCGSCTAGGAYNPTMSDEAIIVNRIGKIFLGGPPLVKAALGEIVTDEDLGGAWLHSSVSGCTDYFAQDEQDAFEMCRDIVESLNMSCVPESKSFDEPSTNFSWSDVEGKTYLNKVELYGVLSKLVDGSCFKEFKAFYGPNVIAGTAYIEGNMVGLISNVGEILSPEALKVTHFLNLCNRRNTPIIFLQNSEPTDISDQSDSTLLKTRGSLTRAVAMLSVPKISVTLTACRNDDHLLMCGPSFNPNFNFAWPGSTISSFPMTYSSPDDNVSSSDSEEETDAFYAAHNLLIDSVILPETTRTVLAESIRILQQQNLNPYKEIQTAPVFRM